MSQYDLKNVNNDINAITDYVIRAMNECNFSLDDQDKYRQFSKNNSYNNFLNASVEVINKCNRIYNIKNSGKSRFVDLDFND